MRSKDSGARAAEQAEGRAARARAGSRGPRLGLALGLALALGGGAAAQGLPELATAPAAATPLPAATPLEAYGASASADPVGPGDLLDVRIFGQPQLSGSLRVGPDGVIAPPFLPPLAVAGRTPEAIQRELGRAYGGMLLHPLVSVRLLENNSRKVSVNGEVPRPGVYAFSGELSLLQALALAGGVDPVKASPEVLLFHQPPVASRRGPDGQLTYTANAVLETIDLNRIPGHPQLNRVLQPGDTIDVQEARQVYLSGDVMRPGAQALLPGLTLSQLIASAGGFLPQADTGQVRVLRLLPSGQRQTLREDVGAVLDHHGPDLALQADDIVLVSGSLLRMAGLQLLDFFTGTERWRVQQTVANHIP
ncbi:MAG TPA: polysaccharide biosynthesis/export family protein [Terriglobales bacterium]|nr:polysaccharide biosynthesis/export family protein [Terriglobales bacterium]